MSRIAKREKIEAKKEREKGRESRQQKQEKEQTKEEERKCLLGCYFWSCQLSRACGMGSPGATVPVEDEDMSQEGITKRKGKREERGESTKRKRDKKERARGKWQKGPDVTLAIYSLNGMLKVKM